GPLLMVDCDQRQDIQNDYIPVVGVVVVVVVVVSTKEAFASTSSIELSLWTVPKQDNSNSSSLHHRRGVVVDLTFQSLSLLHRPPLHFHLNLLPLLSPHDLFTFDQPK